jgi:autotransporter-associated beta strand protein
MLGLIWGERSGWGSHRHRIRRSAAARRGRRPVLEGLEQRIALAAGTATWNSTAATTANWMDATNWLGDVAPVPGDNLVFPSLPSNFQLDTNDDFPDGTNFNSITIDGSGYTLAGNSLDLTTGLTGSFSGTSTISLNMELTATPAAPVSVSSGTTLAVMGVVSGSVGMDITGGGTLDLDGVNTYSGQTTVESATTLLVNGTVPGDVQLNGGTLVGNGTVNSVTSVGGTIEPGDLTAPGVLTVTAPSGSTAGSGVTLDSSSTFTTELNGTSPGNGTTGYGQLVVSPPPTGATAGTINLGSAKLQTSLGTSYTPTPGDQLTLIDNETGSAITGTFAGLPEGAEVTVATATTTYLFRISYAGGTNGQDVVLTGVSLPSTTTLSVSSNTINYTQSVTLTATVSGIGATPTGSVEFFDGTPGSGGTSLATVPLTGTMATTTVPNLGVSGSPHQIYAVFIPTPGTDTYAGSTSAPQSVTVNPITLTVTGVTAENKQYDATTTATININGATLVGVLPADQGNVTLNDANVSGAFSSPNVGIGVPVTVIGLSLSGSASTNYVLTQPTGVTASISPAPLTLTANNLVMNAGGPVPTLTFTATGFVGTDTTADLTTQPTLTTTATSNSPPGMYPIDITGGTAANYTISDVPGTMTVVLPTATTTTLTSSSPFSQLGTTMTFTATIVPAVSSDGTPTGSVEFVVDGSLAGTEPVNSSGQASFLDSSLTAGTHTIVAEFIGNPPFENSTSNSLTQTVVTSLSGTTTTLSSSSQLSVIGQPVTFTATVTPAVPGIGTPTGTVLFVVDNTQAYEEPLNTSTGQATLTISTIGNGFHSVVAVYSGDDVFQSSTSSTLNQFVSLAGTTPVLTVVPVVNRHGKVLNFDLVLTVTPTAPAGGTPSGSATFYINGRASTATVAVTDGIAVLRRLRQRLVNQYVFARYNGSLQYLASATSNMYISNRRLTELARAATSGSTHSADTRARLAHGSKAR